MHVPISHATLQCSATPPSACMLPRPNPSFLSTVASRQCLGALSLKEWGATEGMYRRQGRMLSVKTVWRTAGLQGATPILLLHLHLSPAALWNYYFIACLKMELKHSFVSNFLQAFQAPPCPHCMLFSYELNSASLSDIPLFCCCTSFPAFLFFFPLCLLILIFLAHFVLSTIFLSLQFSSLLSFTYSLFFPPLYTLIYRPSPLSLFLSLSSFIYPLFPLLASTVSLADSYSGTPMRGPDETQRVL